MDAGTIEDPIFTVADHKFGWKEIVLAARLWGEWQPFFERTRRALACLQAAVTFNQALPANEIRAAANAFRYAHNLISAEETNSWLARWQMTVEDWMNYFRGQWLRDQWTARLGDIAVAHPISDAEVFAVIQSHAVCADKLRDWAIKLAGRAALALYSDSFQAVAQSSGDLIAGIEAEYQRQQRQTITPKLLETKIANHRLDWIRYDCRYVWFPEKCMAREAAWCVSEDGLSLDEVADDARGVVQHWNFYLDELDAAVRPQFLAARAGDYLGPIHMLEGFPLFSIVAKTMPAAADPQIRGRAEQAIVTSCLEQAINERVKWAA